MSKARILITGATGKTGGAVIAALLDSGHPLRALVHRRDARSDKLAAAGIEVAVAGMHDADALTAAMRDVQRVYYLPIFAPHALHGAAVFAAVAREAGIEAVVQMSQWIAHRAHPSVLTRETWAIDRLFAMIPGVAHVILRPGMFADNFLRVMDFATLLRVYPILSGTSRSAPVSTEDIGRAAAAALLAPDVHAGMAYHLTGPALMSGRDMAAEIAGVIGHGVIPVDLPYWMFNRVARMQRANPHEIFSYRDYMAEHRAGGFEFAGGVGDGVERLTGRAAEPFADIARRYAVMPFARPTLGNRLRALARFSVVPLWPGYDLARYARAHGFAQPAATSLAVEDAQWRAERLAEGARQGVPTLRAV